METQVAITDKVLKDFSNLQIISSDGIKKCNELGNFIRTNLCQQNDMREVIENSQYMVWEFAKYNRPVMQLLIVNYIGKVMDFCGLDKKSVSMSSIGIIVDTILDTYGYLQVEELRLVFLRGMKQGKQFYGRLDGQTLLSWFRDYANERCNMCEGLQIGRKKELDKTDSLVGIEARNAYLRQVSDKASSGDEEALRQVELINKNAIFNTSMASEMERLRNINKHAYDKLAVEDAKMVDKIKHKTV